MFTSEERRKELKILMGEMRDKPSRDWGGAKERAWVLSRMLAREARRPS